MPSKKKGQGGAARSPRKPEPAAAPAGETIAIGDLVADPGNCRLHPEENRKAIRNSLERFGPARSLVIDGNGIVRAGNGTLAEAIESGLITRVRVIEPAPDELIAVRRSDWSEEEATAYALADNRTAELAEWDTARLATALRDLKAADRDAEPGRALASATGFDAKAIADLISEPRESRDRIEPVRPERETRAWLLFGLPLGRWGEVQDILGELEGIPGGILETTVSDAEARRGSGLGG